MLKFTNLTGRRSSTTKVTDDPIVVASSVKGQFQIYPTVAKALQIEDGDSVLLVVGENEETGEKDVFIAKGKTGTPVKDENGEIKKDKVHRTIFEENSRFGAMVREKTEGSEILVCTVTSAWEAVGGAKDRTITLSVDVDNGIESEVETGNEEYPTHQSEFFKLEVEKVDVKEEKEEEGEEEDASVSERQEVETEEEEDYPNEEI